MMINGKLNIEKYDVNLKDQAIVLYLKEYCGSRKAIATFEGVYGHAFRQVLDGNIILDISEVDPEEFHNNHADELNIYQHCGLAFDTYSCSAFCEGIKRSSYKILVVTGQYGFNGWVFCKKYQVKESE